MSAEFWAIMGVGAALAGLQWRMYASLNGRMDRIEARIDRMQEDLASVKERLARIEDWIDGRFTEGVTP